MFEKYRKGIYIKYIKMYNGKMNKKFIFIVLVLCCANVSSQEDNDYLINLNEVYEILCNNYVLPFKHNDFINNNNSVVGFGYKLNPFTNVFHFSNQSIFMCKTDEEIYSMTDGVVISNGYNGIKIYYICVLSENINVGDEILKGQLIGKIIPPYYHFGPALLLSIKYKEYYFDPTLLFYGINK